MKWFDDFFEHKTRRVAQSSSRRSALAKLGKVFVGTAFVLPYRERAEGSPYAVGSFRQLVHTQVLVAFVVRRHSDAKGAQRVAGFDAYKDAIESALAGWIGPGMEDPMELVAAQAAPMGNGVTAYVQTWETSRFLEGS